MKSFSLPSVTGAVTSFERAFAPSSLPTVLSDRGLTTASAEHELSREWNAEAPTLGFVVGAAAVGIGYVLVRLLRSK